jgi:fructokinase
VKIISIGEILWDVFGQDEYLGGAPFNFAAHARRLGHDVVFVSAVGDDERGRAALLAMEQLRLRTRFVTILKGQSTGIVSVQLDSAGQPSFLIHRPAAYDLVELSESDLAEISAQQADWIYFGTLHQMSPKARDLLTTLIATNPGARRFYDVNLRVNSYNAALVEALLKRSSVVKLNDSEVNTIQTWLGGNTRSIEEFSRNGVRAYGWEAVCVTRGAQGCSLLVGGEYADVDAYPVQVADTVGSGDAFAAAFLHGLNHGWPAAKIGDFANRVGALVASRRGAVPNWTVEECWALARPAAGSLRQGNREAPAPGGV